MTLIDFCVDLLDGLLSDVEGRVEVTVTDDNVFLGAVELVEPGTGRTLAGTFTYDYRAPTDVRAHMGDWTLGHMIEDAIRRALTADESWMRDAYQQARRAA
jgi:hypothetical protein